MPRGSPSDGYRPRYDRPLHGPKAHPFLVVTRALDKALRAAPASERDTRRVKALRQIAAEHGQQFADIVAWALEERAHAETRPVNGRHKQTVCKQGHSLAPGSPHLEVGQDGTRCCGTCRRKRLKERGRRRVA